MEWTLEGFLKGKEWSHRYARISLPVLVARAEKYRGWPDGEIPDYTYGDLAAEVASREYAQPIQHALGSIGYALKALQQRADWKFGEIPPLQLIAWSSGKGSPGDDAFSFVGINKKDARAMSPEVRRHTAGSIRRRILEYEHWRDVLGKLGLKPLTLDLPEIGKVTAELEAGRGGPETEEHKRLKHYVGRNYHLIGIKGRFAASFEEMFLSGDKADVMLDDAGKRQRICIEVKSRVSKSADVMRGIFQCVKYRAILAAQESYELKRNPMHQLRKLQTFLVTESELPGDLKELSNLLDVMVFTVRVPVDFRVPVE
jgi:hypothetical protein